MIKKRLKRYPQSENSSLNNSFIKKSKNNILHKEQRNMLSPINNPLIE